MPNLPQTKLPAGLLKPHRFSKHSLSQWLTEALFPGAQTSKVLGLGKAEQVLAARHMAVLVSFTEKDQ